MGNSHIMVQYCLEMHVTTKGRTYSIIWLPSMGNSHIMAQYCLEMHVITKSQMYLTVASNRFDTLVKLALFGCLVWATAI